MIDYSQLGFIGKAFQSNELTRLAQFLLLFYDQMPCDLLVGDWMISMTQSKRIDYWKRYPSLFQHIGIFRSLGGFQILQEKKFGKLIFDNPPATILWNFTVVPTYEGKFAYIPGGELGDRNDVCDFKASRAHRGKIKRCWFWGKTINAGDHLTLVFDQAINIKGVFVEFGKPEHLDDLLHVGQVQVADNKGPGTPASMSPGNLDLCGKFHYLAEVNKQPMVYWEDKVSTPAALPVPKARCLRIQATANQTAWAIVFQIQVRTH
jgi:alpha-1,3-mannosylglycoprotein beta-1,4-N-acetylglucosaminyltransferase C